MRRDFALMHRAEERALRKGQVLSPGAQPLVDREMDQMQPGPDTPPSLDQRPAADLTMSVVLVVGL